MTNIEDSFENFLLKQNSIRERNIIVTSIKQDFLNGKLDLPIPIWKIDDNEIDLTLQRDKIHPKLLEKGISVIKDVSLDRLLNLFTIQDQRMFTGKELFDNKFNDTTISTILDFWKKDQSLLPPTICIFNKDYMELVCKNGIPSKELQPIDGKHRLRTAIYCGASKIPILVPTFQLEWVKKKLFTV